MTYNTFQDMLDSLKPQQTALDFWREVDRWQQAATIGESMGGENGQA